MKNFKHTILTIIAGIALNASGSLFGQAPVPAGINYQAIARNSSGSVLSSQAIAVKISILQGSATGTVQYVETHTTTTNSFGLFSFKIGGGTPVSGNFSDVTWNTANQFIKIEVDPAGGTNFTTVGTNELLSVPYALYSETSGTGGPQGPAGPAGAQGPAGAAGSQGPQGVQGTTGPQGAQGPAGGNGLDGKTILNGATNPSNGSGNNGDYYINNTTSTLFGPKTGGMWGAGVSLIGPQGIPGTGTGGGADGKTVLNGTTNPNSGIGTNGDFYINTTTNTIYGPKASGAWPSTGVSLVGPAGATGSAGATGAAGAQGAAGPAGPAGAQGPSGTTGATGPAGVAGATGATGAAGADGKTILNGTTAPSSGVGVNGDFYINTATNTIFGPKAGGVWGGGTSLVGATGAAGPAGANGTNGATGPAGAQGPAGPTGATGPAGSGGGTLDQAYDFGGAGAGKTITADSGPVIINASGTGTAGLTVSLSGTGNAIQAGSSNAANTFATIQATTNSTTATNSAVFGSSTAAAAGVTGQISAGGTSYAGVYGNNLRSTGGVGVGGIGVTGIGGETSSATGFGVFGIGNGLAYTTGEVTTSGAGAAFNGFNTGLFTKNLNFAPFVEQAAIYTLDGNAVPTAEDQVIVNYWSATDVHYKILGGGTVSTIVRDVNDNAVVMHAPESPEIHFEDYGSGKLNQGVTHITIDPTFAKNIAVNEKHPLRVYIQVEGDCKGVFVTNKTTNGFDVVELDGGKSSTSFQWHIVANRADKNEGGRMSHYEDVRFESAPAPQKLINVGKIAK